MKTKVDREILRKNFWLVVGPVLFVLLGIFCIILPDRPIDYASLQTKEVTVEAIKHHYVRHGADYHDIRTTDGERYVTTGDYRREQLEELLTKGTVITIKWYESDFGRLCAEEVYVDGDKVAVYNEYNNLSVKNNMRLIVGFFGIAFGLVCLYFVKLILVSLTEQKAKNTKLLGKRKKARNRNY